MYLYIIFVDLTDSPFESLHNNNKNKKPLDLMDPPGIGQTFEFWKWISCVRKLSPGGLQGLILHPFRGGRIKECKMYGGFCRISGKTVMQLCRLVIVTSYIYYNEGLQPACQRMIGVCNHLGMRSRDREKVEFIWLHNTYIRGL